MKRWLQLSWRERRVLVAAVAATSIARVALLIMPWPRVANRGAGHAVPTGNRQPATGNPVAPATGHPVAAATGHSVAFVRDLSWAIDVCGRRVPWATCLSNALAARWLLARRGVEAAIELGTYDDDARRFHARVVCDGRAIVGQREMVVLVRLEA